MEKSSEIEMVLYFCKECYIYTSIPPASTIGHRADAWGVNNWDKVNFQPYQITHFKSINFKNLIIGNIT